MVLLVILTTLLFLIISFVSNTTIGDQNPILGFLSVQTGFIQRNLSFILFGLLMSLIIFVLVKKFDKSTHFLKRIQICVILFSQVLLLGFLLSFVLLFVIAFLELNIFALVFDLNPKVLGVEEEVKVIVNALEHNNQSPDVIPAENDPGKELSAIATATGGRSNFYGKYILPQVPGFLILPIKKPSSSIILVDNSLIITKMVPEDIQKVSPTIGYLFLKQYFWGRKIKFYPRLTIMRKNEYIKFRGLDANRKSGLVADEIKKIESAISSTSAAISTEQANIEDNKNQITKLYLDKNKQYSKCLSGGKYQNKVFVHYYTQDECKQSVGEISQQIDLLNSQISSLTRKLKNDQNQLASYQYIKVFYNSQSDIVKSSSINIPHELGVFDPPDSIKIVVNTDSSQATVDYFETFVHEYLHFASFVPGHNLKDSFFEEGLTEYFARNIINNQFLQSTNLAYPVQVKIIEEMTKVIPENELTDIYFTKDQAKLVATLDRVYGDGFYNKNASLFEALQYSSDINQTLKLANDIMRLISGTQLNKKDLYAAPSSL